MLQGSTSRRTWTATERWIQIDRFREGKTASAKHKPRTCWIICDSVPVCVAIDRPRPCTPTESSAFHQTQTKSSSPLAADAQAQLGFIVEGAHFTIRQLLTHHELPMKTWTKMNETPDMSEPTQVTRAGKRKEILTRLQKSYGHCCL